MNRTEITAALQQIETLAGSCIRAINSSSPKVRASGLASAQRSSASSLNVDFAKPFRPFVKAYTKGLSGPKKFTVLLSWLAKGEPTKDVPLREIEEHWNRMTSLLEMKFNRFFPARAKDNDGSSLRKRANITCGRPGRMS